MAIDSGSSLQFSVNGVTQMTLPTSGAISVPSQVCFSAYNNTVVTQTTTKNTWNTLYNNCSGWGLPAFYPWLNTGSGFNASNGVFTAPHSGKYLFNITVAADQKNTWYIQFYKNNTGINPFAMGYEAEGYLYGYNSYETSQLTYIYHLEANDTMTIGTYFYSATYNTYVIGGGYAGIIGIFLG